MTRINDHYLKLSGAYLFPEIARRVAAYSERQAEDAAPVIRCGVGDVTEPLTPAVIKAMHAAVDEMGCGSTFRGYGPPYGYDFLREAIARVDFRERGINVDVDEIIISDGSKTDAGAILEILATGTEGGQPVNRVGITDPVYPVYVDTNVMAGNTGRARDGGGYEGLHSLVCRAENGFVPEPPDTELDVVYLCFPNNPTGGMINRQQLEAWVAWARERDALILYDAAYADYIQDPALPRSIFEVDGARECAIEFHSFSKNGGFTGVRCGYTVCPAELTGLAADGRRVQLLDLWKRRWSTRSNSVAYVVQRAAEALYSLDGRAESSRLVDGYMANAAALRQACSAMGMDVHGGEHAPYVWVRCPDGMDSWGTFDHLLETIQVVVTPGVGFGPQGEGWFRISAFNSAENVAEVTRRMLAARAGSVSA
ncbi:MAG: LL-diaminopimelate aminotransferase [Phycisphaerales bacterium]